MLTYSAHAIPGGYAVAYTRPDGTLCGVMDCGTREAAITEAARLNLVQQANAKASLLVSLREHAIAPRRPVRWFPDDAFA